MVMKKYYYERSNLLESEVNINFEELLWMNDEQTTEWIESLRKFILKEWDEKGIPPTIGQNTKDIKKNFRKLRDYPLHQGKKQFLTKDEDTGEYDVIKNYNKHASGVNQFFPTMLKTRVNKSSIYTWFTDEYKDRFQKVIRRILKRDSMYNWSRCLLENEKLSENFFVVQHKKNSVESGYLTLSKSEVENLNTKHTTNLPKELDDTKYKSSTEQRWESFNSRASKINAPIFYVGGNNDLSNNVMKKSWKDKYGPTYYHFIYKNILFLVLDTEDYSKKSSNLFSYTMDAQISGDIGIQQKDYFLEVIENNQDVDWTFLFMHKPIWLKEEEPEFFAIEAALTKRPYTLFNGHLHNYSYNKRKERDYIMLGTTGGRQRTKEKNSFDHVTLVTVDKNGPSIVNLKLEGILDKKGEIPIQGKELCFHAYSCN